MHMKVSFDREDRKALVGSLLVLLLGVGFAFAGSDGALFHDGKAHPFALCVGLAFLIQWIVFVPSFWRQTEKFFDLTGSLTYLSVAGLGLSLTPKIDARSLLLFSMISIWAIRLGWFLFHRIHKTGKDGRFDALKPSLFRFLGAWTLQGLWVVFTLAAALTAIVSTKPMELGLFALTGGAIWLLGFLIEAIADQQKRTFSGDSKNRGKFIQTGLWSISRHPNYLGEIMLWIGVAVIAFPVLVGWQWLTLTSPFFVALLLIRVSGIPLLEKRADAKWGDQEDYEAYKLKTPILLPWVGRT